MTLSRVQNVIYNNILYISLYISVIGILAFLAFFFGMVSLSSIWEIRYFIDFSAVDLVFFNHDFFIIPFGYFNVSLLNPLFSLLLLVGASIHAISNKKENRLLDFCFAILFIGALLAIIELIIQVSINLMLDGLNIFEYYSFPILILFIFKFTVMLFVSYTYLHKSYEHKKLISIDDSLIKIYLKNSGKSDMLAYERASKIQRFGHYLIDGFIILIVFSKYIYSLSNIVESLTYFFSFEAAITIMYFIASIFYYLVFESIFKITPGKCLLNTRIVNCRKDKILFGQHFIRTLSRKIPFEVFSFLGQNSAGWHDKLSNTAVVQQQADAKYGKLAEIVIAIFALILVVIAIINLTYIF